MYLNTRIFLTTGYARVLLFMFIRRELGGTRTGCLFQFTYCVSNVKQNKDQTLNAHNGRRGALNNETTTNEPSGAGRGGA